MVDRLQQSDDEKISQVAQWIVEGERMADVRRLIQSTYPDSDAKILLMLAMDHFQAVASFDSPVVIGWCFEASKDLYRRMVDSGDFVGALRAVKQISDLVRAHVPKGQETETDGTGTQ